MPRYYRKKRGRRRPFNRRRRMVRYRRPKDHFTTVLRYAPQTAASDVLGSISLIFNAFNCSGALDWGNISGLWDQYRVCSITVKYFPYQQPANSLSTSNIAPLYIVNDYDDAISPGSTSELLQYKNVRVVNLYRQWKHTMRFSFKASKQTAGSVGWLDIANPPTVGSIKMLTDPLLDATTLYGTYVIEHVIQLKGRR